MVLDVVIDFGRRFWFLMSEMAPYLLLGFLCAGVLSVFLNERTVARYLGGRGVRAILRATAVGVPLPLCSCGVIPVAASLRRRGAGKGPTAAFLAATPETGADSFLATWGIMGPVFAFVRLGVAFVTGLLAGLLVDRFAADPGTRDAGPVDTGGPAAPGGPTRSLAKGLGQALVHGLVVLPRDLARPLVLGLLLAGVMGVALPPGALADLGLSGPLGYLAVTVLAVPLYVCSTGSIPVAYALMETGISPGAALVFLIAGPATNIATMTTMGRLLGTRAIALYLTAIVLSSWTAGLLFDLATGTITSGPGTHLHESRPGWLAQSCAVALAVILASAVGRKRRAAADGPAPGDSPAPGKTLRVPDMTCGHCESTVKRALADLPGTGTVRVCLESREVWWDGPASGEEVSQAITQAGFTPEPAPNPCCQHGCP